MIPNDERGWILAVASGMACVVGACLINLDVALHILPSWRSFQIHRSTKFLAASLSLSFGVMFFSALFGLLPEAQEYFVLAKYTASTASAAAVGFFLVGVLGLQAISELLHRCLPSSIVSCEEHGAVPSNATEDPERGVESSETHHHRSAQETHESDENTPLLDRPQPFARRVTDVLAIRPRCLANGKCYGYSDHLCQQICALERGKQTCENEACTCTAIQDASLKRPHHFHSNSAELLHGGAEDHVHEHGNEPQEPAEGHHHVPKNKYLSIGVQTSIAIALHKFPEGFITYATNHANPNLGFTVFLALFIHNIAEGFAMALPLYLAFESRLKAVIWASLLGGLAQPIGAGIAWLSIRGREYSTNSEAYGILFSITAGIMCSVGLQLFSQAVQTHHGSKFTFTFAFIGMGILGFSSALTAE